MEQVYIKDEQGNKVLPITSESAVRDANGNPMSSKLGVINDALDARYTKSETYSKTEVNGLVSTPHQNYVTVATYAELLLLTGQADTIYRVSNYDGSTSQVDVSKYSEYAWNGASYTFLRVEDSTDEVFDISVYNSNAEYADLAAALGTNGEHVPASVRKGGMSVKFVCSDSDSKYVQYRLMRSTFTDAQFANPTNWQGVDDEPTAGSENLVKSGGVYDAIADIKTFEKKYTAQSIENNSEPIALEESDFVSGNIDSATGSNISSSVCIRSGYISLSEVVTILCSTSNSYRWDIRQYNIKKEYIKITGNWRTGSSSVNLNSNTAFVRFVIASPSGTSAAPVWTDAAFSCTPTKVIVYKRASSQEDTAILENKINLIKGFSVTQVENPGTASSLWVNNNGTIGYSSSVLGLHRADVINVLEGLFYSLTTGINSSPTAKRAYFCNDSGNILLEINVDTTINSVVPVGATKLYINYYTSYSFICEGTKQDTLVFDPQPQKGSRNSLTSGVVYNNVFKPLQDVGRQVSGGPIELTIENEGYYYSVSNDKITTVASSAYVCYKPISVSKDQIVKISGFSSVSILLLADDSGNVIASSIIYDDKEFEFAIINGVTKLYVYSLITDESNIVVKIIDSIPESVKKYLAFSSGNGFTFLLDDSMFIKGNTHTNTGLIESGGNVITSKFFDIYPGASFSLSTQNSYRLALHFYDDSHQSISKFQWYTSGNVAAPSNAYYVRIIIASPSGSSVLPTVVDAQPTVSVDTSIKYIRAGVSNDNGELEIPIVAPSPQIPADGSEGSDFNAETLKPAELWDAFDELIDSIPSPAYYESDSPKFITRYSKVGRDASNTFDIYAYILGVRNRYAWKNSDKLFAFKNGSTIVFIDSVSPLVGMTIYSDANRTDSGKTVTSFDAANQQFTASDSVVYTKSVEDNVDADVLYSKSPQSKSTLNNLTLYNKSDVSQGAATTVDLTHLTLGGKTYTRCEDLDYNINSKGTILLWGNEHGPQSDPAEPAIVLYRFAKDLIGGCRGNDFISYLKKNYKIVIMPCLNPYGLYNHMRQNRNYVNINRNYPTPGWSVISDGDKGSYAGDQPETQFVINAIAALDVQLAIDIHCLGYLGENNEGRTHYEGYIANSVFLQKLVNSMKEYSFSCSSYGNGDYNTGAQGADWIHYQNISGGLLEMNAGPYASDGGDGRQHKPHYLEADYTLMLGAIRMWLAEIYPALNLNNVGIN